MKTINTKTLIPGMLFNFQGTIWDIDRSALCNDLEYFEDGTFQPIPITGEILRDWFGAKPKFSTKFGLLMNIPSDEGSGLNYVESGETGVTFNVGDIGPFHADHVHEFQFALAFFGLPHEVAPAFLEGGKP